ncbi:hypothetical protein [Lignipirellula cremea]|uniref:hypothetical protein n=1 Tax=Lignipirellula cremea TaxID=2528010 RepID=UPI0018D26092|nr:hypothetical protein [Lignipirellula cremea]
MFRELVEGAMHHGEKESTANLGHASDRAASLIPVSTGALRHSPELTEQSIQPSLA